MLNDSGRRLKWYWESAYNESPRDYSLSLKLPTALVIFNNIRDGISNEPPK